MEPRSLILNGDEAWSFHRMTNFNKLGITDFRTLFQGSLILNDIENLYFSQMTHFKSSALLYRATRDGFNASAFHRKCDGKPNTVTLIKTDSNDVFGGFASAAWNSSGRYMADTSAFVFSLRKKGSSKNEKFMIKPEYSNKALIGNHNYGPIFGGGNDYAVNKRCFDCDYDCYCTGNEYDEQINYNSCDILIIDNSNASQGSETNIGGSYQLPNYLAGSKNKFLTTEIEIYEMK